MARTLTVKLPRPLAARLSARVRSRKTTRSALVREALEGYLEAEGSQREGSFLSLARDVIGSVTGPTDLSSSKRHRRGYGR
jgi:predicted transcriptional regulator